MSTFAGVLIIMSSSLITDIYEHGLKRKLTGSQEVFANRVVSAAVGLISLVIALKPPALILVLTGFAWAVIASTNLWPLLFGLYWKGASKAGVVAVDGRGLCHRARMDLAQEALRNRRLHRGLAREPCDASDNHGGGAADAADSPRLIV